MHTPQVALLTFVIVAGVLTARAADEVPSNPNMIVPEPAVQEIQMPSSALPGDLQAASKPQSRKWVFSLLPIAFQKNPILDFSIMTELTDEGRKLPPPSFSHPVYYLSHVTGYHEEGQSHAGVKEMKYEQLKGQLMHALASNGYRPADDAHPPSQILIYIWGMHNRVESLAIAYDTDGNEISGGRYYVDASNFSNLMSRAQLVGGQKFADELAKALYEQSISGGQGIWSPFDRFRERDNVTRSLVEQVFDDCYFLVVSAYDAARLIKGEKVLLWRTKMTTSANGVSLAQTMPGLINNGAYFFGREMTVPEIITRRPLPDGKVDLGPMEFKGYETSGTSSPPPQGTAVKRQGK